MGDAVFPLGRPSKELLVQDDRLDRCITIWHDNQVLKGTFTLLDQLAAQQMVACSLVLCARCSTIL